MNQTLKISIARGGCRFASPLYLGSSYIISFEGARSDEASRILLIKPRSLNPENVDGFVVLAESFTGSGGTIKLDLNRNVLVKYFESNKALDVDSYVDAHCYVFNEQGDIIADSPVSIEYSPTQFIVDYKDYPSAEEILSQATAAKEQAISAKDSAEEAKLRAENAKTTAEGARDEAQNARTEAQEAKTDAERASNTAEESAEASSMARAEAIEAKDAARDAQRIAEENATLVETALGRVVASVKKVTGGVEVLLWNGQGDKPVPTFIPYGVDGVTGYVKCDEDGKYYCLKCKEVDGEKVLALEQVGVDDVVTDENGNIWVRTVNGIAPDANGGVTIPLNFLPLRGGTIDGELRFARNLYIRRTDNTGYIGLGGGIDHAKGGALLILRGKDADIEDYRKGEAYISVTDGINSKTLYIRPNGALMWANRNIVRFVNGVSADTSGNVALPLNFLPLTGGTLTGALTLSKGDLKLPKGGIKKSGKTNTLDICSGTSDEDSPSLSLYPTGLDSEMAGLFVLRAGESAKKLIGKPDGSLTWEGVNLVRSINGYGADDDGDVLLSYITLHDSSYSYETPQGPFLSVGDLEDGAGRFIMQSGVAKGVDASDGATITFDKPFRDTNYVVVCQEAGRDTASSGGISVVSKSTTGFTIDTYSDEDVMWFAFGYPNE